MRFREAKGLVQLHIMYGLRKRRFPLAFEISVWLTTSMGVWYWIIGFLCTIGVLDFP